MRNRNTLKSVWGTAAISDVGAVSSLATYRSVSCAVSSMTQLPLKFVLLLL